MGKSGGASRSPTKIAERRGGNPPGAKPDGRAHPNVAPRGRAGGERLPQLKAGLAQHEREIMGSAREQARVLDALGNVIVAKTGSAHRVAFTEAEVQKMAGATFTHNHHYTDGLTMEDGRFAAYNGLAEMRAVDALHTYSLRPSTKINWSGDYWEKVIQPSWNRNRDAVANEMRLSAWRTGVAPGAGEGTQQWHMVWERVAKDTGLRYQRTAAPKAASKAAKSAASTKTKK